MSTTAEHPVLAIEGLTTRFETRAGTFDAVRDVSLSVGRGEIVGLVGESGSGKSVTGFSVMGLVDPPGRVAQGSIRLLGEELVGAPEVRLRALRGHRMAMIFQDPMMTLNPVLRIDTQMIEAIEAHEATPRAEARARARDALGQVGIPSPDERLRAYPHQLSGGMRQRVAIAIAFLNAPDLVIADEPTTALDVTIQSQILAQAQNMAEERGTAMIWVTHDLGVVAGLVDRLAVMYAGRVVESGTAEEVLTAPRHPYTVGLIRSVPGGGETRGARLFQIPGMTPSPLALPRGCAFGQRCDRADDACLIEPAISDGTHGVRCHHPVVAGGPT